MVGAVDERDRDVDHRVTGDDARLQRFAHALLDRGDELARDAPLGDLVLKHKSRPALARPHIHLGVTELALASALADEPTDAVRRPLDRLLVSDLRLALVGIDVELAHQAVDDDLEVQLAHAGDDRLAGLVVGVDLERRVFLGQPLQPDAELVLVGLRLGLDGDRDHGLREGDRLQKDRVALVRQRVAGGRRLEPDGRRDVTREHLVDVLAADRVHAQDAADPLLAPVGRVQYRGARAQPS